MPAAALHPPPASFWFDPKRPSKLQIALITRLTHSLSDARDHIGCSEEPRELKDLRATQARSPLLAV